MTVVLPEVHAGMLPESSDTGALGALWQPRSVVATVTALVSPQWRSVKEHWVAPAVALHVWACPCPVAQAW